MAESTYNNEAEIIVRIFEKEQGIVIHRQKALEKLKEANYDRMKAMDLIQMEM